MFQVVHNTAMQWLQWLHQQGGVSFSFFKFVSFRNAVNPHSEYSDWDQSDFFIISFFLTQFEDLIYIALLQFKPTLALNLKNEVKWIKTLSFESVKVNIIPRVK